MGSTLMPPLLEELGASAPVAAEAAPADLSGGAVAAAADDEEDETLAPTSSARSSAKRRLGENSRL